MVEQYVDGYFEFQNNDYSCSLPDIIKPPEDLSGFQLQYYMQLSAKLVQPIMRFTGLNTVLMCGHSRRLFFGHKPKALLITFFCINLPAVIFAAFITPDEKLWGDWTVLYTVLYCLLVLCSNILMLLTGSTDPGIIPSLLVSQQAKRYYNKKYIGITFKWQRVSYLMQQSKARYGAEFANARMAQMKFCETCLIFRP